MAQKLDRILSKLAFVDSYLEVCHSESLQSLCHITEVVFKGTTDYEYVVYVQDYKLVNVDTEDMFQ